MNNNKYLLIFLVCLFDVAFVNADDIYSMSLEQLMDIEVSSVNKSESSLMKSAASVYVVTSDEIKRKAARNVPEALKGVPGLHVAQINQNSWSIASRGFSGKFANKLLVLIDGRAVYTHLFSGVFWEQLEVDIYDVERIEVIKGPGATLWGANAVSGVINIITKNAKDTEGLRLVAGTGTEANAETGLRYGGKISENASYRIWSNYSDYEESRTDSNLTANDSYKRFQMGGRIDSKLNSKENNTLQFGYTNLEANMNAFLPLGTNPPNSLVPSARDNNTYTIFLLNKWKKSYSDNSDAEVQFFLDRDHQDHALVDATTDRFDFEFKRRQPLFSKHEIIWGVGHRYISDNIVSLEDLPGLSFNPMRVNLNRFNAFIQTELRVIPDELSVTVGTKLEHNDFTGFEFQPSIRALYAPNKSFSLWGAISRAVRTPSRAETAFSANTGIQNIPGVGPLTTKLIPPPSRHDAEVNYSYELGMRYIANKKLSFDVSTFYSKYSNLLLSTGSGVAIDTSVMPPSPFIPITFDNLGAIDNYGVEAVIDLIPASWINLRATYSHIRFDVARTGGLDTAFDDAVPVNLATLRASISLPYKTEIDTNFRFTDSINSGEAEAYSQLDLRIAKQLNENITLELIGRNLLHSQQREYYNTVFSQVANQMQREFFVRLTWLFD